MYAARTRNEPRRGGLSDLQRMRRSGAHGSGRRSRELSRAIGHHSDRLDGAVSAMRGNECDSWFRLGKGVHVSVLRDGERNHGPVIQSRFFGVRR